MQQEDQHRRDEQRERELKRLVEEQQARLRQLETQRVAEIEASRVLGGEREALRAQLQAASEGKRKSHFHHDEERMLWQEKLDTAQEELRRLQTERQEGLRHAEVKGYAFAATASVVADASRRLAEDRLLVAEEERKRADEEREDERLRWDALRVEVAEREASGRLREQTLQDEVRRVQEERDATTHLRDQALQDEVRRAQEAEAFRWQSELERSRSDNEQIRRELDELKEHQQRTLDMALAAAPGPGGLGVVGVLPGSLSARSADSTGGSPQRALSARIAGEHPQDLAHTVVGLRPARGADGRVTFVGADSLTLRARRRVGSLSEETDRLFKNMGATLAKTLEATIVEKLADQAGKMDLKEHARAAKSRQEGQLLKEETEKRLGDQIIRLQQERQELEMLSSVQSTEKYSLKADLSNQISKMEEEMNRLRTPEFEGIPSNFQMALLVVHKHGCKPLKWHDGYSAMHWAAQNIRLEVLDYLLKKDGESLLKLTDVKNRTPLDYANAALRKAVAAGEKGAEATAR